MCGLDKNEINFFFCFTTALFLFSKTTFIVFGSIFCFSRNLINFFVSSNFLFNFSILSKEASPRSKPFLVNLSSALSCLNSNLYSALEVNILYGSSVPFVIKSSINTPMYASERLSVNSFFPLTF